MKWWRITGGKVDRYYKNLFSINTDFLAVPYSGSLGVKLLLISDSCHSGTVAKFTSFSTPPAIKGSKAADKQNLKASVFTGPVLADTDGYSSQRLMEGIS